MSSGRSETSPRRARDTERSGCVLVEHHGDEFGRLSASQDDFKSQSQLFGTTNVVGFGRVILHDATTLAGPIQCSSAGDAWLDGTVVAGPGAPVSGCEHGVLPP